MTVEVEIQLSDVWLRLGFYGWLGRPSLFFRVPSIIWTRFEGFVSHPGGRCGAHVETTLGSEGPPPLSWFDSLADVSSDSAMDSEDWLLPALAFIRSWAAPVDCLTGFTHPLAKTLVMGDLNAVLMAQLAHVGLLPAQGVGGDAGDLVDCKIYPRDCFFVQFGWGGWVGGGGTVWSLY